MPEEMDSNKAVLKRGYTVTVYHAQPGRLSSSTGVSWGQVEFEEGLNGISKRFHTSHTATIVQELNSIPPCSEHNKHDEET